MLDNWYFANPVNQRGQTKYTSAGYTIDRWKSDNAINAVSVLDGYIRFSKVSDSGANPSLNQVLEEENFLDHDQTFTLSIICRGKITSRLELVIKSKTGAIGEKFINLDLDDADFGLKSYSVIVPKDYRVESARVAQMMNTNPVGAYIDIYAAKLELGPVQTLAHQDADGNWVLNDPPPDKALELAKCQRYLVNIGQAGAFLADAGLNGNKPRVFLNKKLYPMRAKPTLLTTSLSSVTFLGSTQFANAKAATFTNILDSVY